MNDLDKIHRYFSDYGKRNPTIGIFQLGIHNCIFDCILVNCHHQKIRGFEFKVSRSDFLNDKNNGKWKKYLRWCHTFTWVCPEGLIQVDEIEKPAGLLWITEKQITYWNQKIKTFYQDQWKKRPSGTKVSQKDYIEVISLLLNRVKYRKEAFF